MTDETKTALLAHYAIREPKRFAQLDCWLDADDVMGRDADGHGLTGGTTTELMHGADIRLLIPVDTKASTAELLVLLRRAADWIENGALALFAELREASDERQAQTARRLSEMSGEPF